MFFPFTKKSKEIIAPRLLFLILIFSGIVTLLITLIQLYIDYQRNIDAIDDQFKKIEIILINPLGQALWFMNEDSLQVQLEGILNFRDIEYLELVGEGSISITAGKKVSKHAIQKILPLTYNDDVIEKQIGSLTVVASTSGIYSRLLKHLITILISQAIKTFLVSVFIFLIVHHLVTKHLFFISSYLKHIDIQKSISKLTLQREPISVKDELDQVVISINEMICKQKESYNTVEQVVLKRTSDLTQKNEELKQQKEKAQKYLDVVGVMLVALNSSGEIALINKYGCKLLKTSEAEAIGKNWFDHFLPKRMVDDVKSVFEKLKTGNTQEVEKYENLVLTSDGDERIVAFNNTILVDEKGRIDGILFSGEDVSDQRKLESQLQQAQKMESIGILAGGIAHDFNNLLYVVMGNISLAHDDLKPESGTSETLKEAEQACIKAKELSARLITFSKGGYPVRKITSIDDSLKNIVAATLSGSDIKPEISISDDIRQVNIDEDQIKQAVRNIVVNAREAMENNGQLKVSCENVDIAEEGYLTLSQGEHIKISFEDQGCGISKENLEKIFDPYFSTKNMGADKGQGLGLTISYSIIQKHGGLITVESELGTGSTFSVYLPAFLVKEPDIQKPEEKPTAQKLVKKPVTGTGKILLMDDEEAIRTLLRMVISKLGYDVETCIEGRAVIEIYKKAMESKEPFDMVILDLSNKIGLGGQETMRRLLEIDPDVKGIIITGYSDDPVVANFRAYGFSGFVIKPVTRDELSKVINEVLSRD